MAAPVIESKTPTYATATIVYLANGSPTGVNPAGGGFFYVVAGVLHWVGSGGSDTTIAPA